MANLKGKIESEVEIKSSSEKYYNFFKTPHHVPNVAGEHIQGVDMHEGDWDSHGHGSVKIWQYTAEGISGTFKEKVHFDDENKTAILEGQEGDMFNEYKSFKPMFQVIPKGEGSLVKLSIEYEKLSENIPPPNKYLNMMVHITNDVDAHLRNN